MRCAGCTLGRVCYFELRTVQLSPSLREGHYEVNWMYLQPSKCRYSLDARGSGGIMGRLLE